MANRNQHSSQSSDSENELQELIRLKENELNALKSRMEKRAQRRNNSQHASTSAVTQSRSGPRSQSKVDLAEGPSIAAPGDEMEEPDQSQIFDCDGNEEFVDNNSLGHYFEIHNTESKTSLSRKSKTEINTIQFHNFSDSVRPDTLLERIIEALYERVLQGGPKPTYIGFQVLLPSVGKSFYIPLRSLDQNNPKAVASEFAKLNSQSNGSIDLQAEGESVVTKVFVQYGSATNPVHLDLTGGNPTGRPKIVSDDEESVTSDEEDDGEERIITDAEWSAIDEASNRGMEEGVIEDLTIDEEVHGQVATSGEVNQHCHEENTHTQNLQYSNKRPSTLIRVHNPQDSWCLIRAIVCGIAWHRWQNGSYSKKQLDNFVNDQNKKQTSATQRLIEQVGLSLQKTEGYGLDDVKKVQAYFDANYPGHYRIAIFSQQKRNRLVWASPKLATEIISLHLNSGHYDFIGKPAQLFKARDYCIDCQRVVYPRVFHPLSCKVVCHMCLRFGTPDFPCKKAGELPRIRCVDCGFVFESQSCFDYHKRTRQRPNRLNARTDTIDARCLRRFQSICETRFVCKDCHNVVRTRQGPHNCEDGEVRLRGEFPCEECDKVHTTAHPFCYIQRVSEIEEGTTEGGISTLRYVWFDAETTQNNKKAVVNGIEVEKHVANLIVAEFLCVQCIREGITTGEKDSMRRSEKCLCGISLASNYRSRMPQYRSRRLQFDNFNDEKEDVVQKFLDWLLHFGPTAAKTIVIAHNGGKFDFHLLLEKLMLKNVPVSLVMTGLKIYTMQIKKQGYRHLVFKDSLNFFNAPLSALPAIFGLAVAEKGYFPHYFNTREHLNKTYMNLPDRKYYGFDDMKAKARDKFIQWHDLNRNRPFCLGKEIVAYCRNDVEILREATLCFLRNYDEMAGVNPFNSVSTIAGLALHVYRKCFLPEHVLVNVGEQGYRASEFSSIIANKFMRLFEIVNDCQVRSALWSVGEERIGDSGKRIDVVVRASGHRPLAIEFQGCFYHGCLHCFRDRTQHLAGNRTAEQLLTATRNRIHHLETQGYRVKEVWECDFKRDLQRNPELRRKFDEIVLPDGPLNPRAHVLRGGRVEPFMLHYRCTENEEIIYIDIVSLYPYVMKASPFPIGDPEVLTRDQIVRQLSECIEHEPSTSTAVPVNSTVDCGTNTIQLPLTNAANNPYKGLLLVHILPPTQLKPVLLPYRTKSGHLVFTLCASCAESRQQETRCQHIDAQRSWITGYTHVEINEALRHGYTILDVYEVWNYKTWADVETGNALFTDYINLFLKYKVEASGWPDGIIVPDDNVETERRKVAFCDEYRSEEGITIDPAAMKFNAGKRQISKLMLNSAWGKLAQRADTTSVSITTTSDEYFTVIQNSELEVLDVEHITENLDRIVHRKRKVFVSTPKTNNVPIAAFVTSYARLHLYKYMCEVVSNGGRLLYCDTDSIVYVIERSALGCREGKRLGQMSREMPERRIIEFVAPGPKNWGFLHVQKNATVEDAINGESTLKICGFNLNYNASQKLTFHTVKQLVFRCYGRGNYINGSQLQLRDQSLDNAEDDDDPHININYTQITRTKTSMVYNRPINKMYRVAYTKGRVIPGTYTIEPYGYQP